MRNSSSLIGNQRIFFVSFQLCSMHHIHWTNLRFSLARSLSQYICNNELMLEIRNKLKLDRMRTAQHTVSEMNRSGDSCHWHSNKSAIDSLNECTNFQVAKRFRPSIPNVLSNRLSGYKCQMKTSSFTTMYYYYAISSWNGINKLVSSDSRQIKIIILILISMRYEIKINIILLRNDAGDFNWVMLKNYIVLTHSQK